jgi:hypothetical protein
MQPQCRARSALSAWVAREALVGRLDRSGDDPVDSRLYRSTPGAATVVVQLVFDQSTAPRWDAQGRSREAALRATGHFLPYLTIVKLSEREVDCCPPAVLVAVRMSR